MVPGGANGSRNHSLFSSVGVVLKNRNREDAAASPRFKEWPRRTAFVLLQLVFDRQIIRISHCCRFVP